MTILKRLENLEKQTVTLASRPYTQRAEEAKTEAVTAQTKTNLLDAEIADMFLAMAEMITGGDGDE